jgi:hypothetical protein
MAEADFTLVMRQLENFTLVMRQLERMCNEMRDMRTQLGVLSSIRDEQLAQRSELQLLREQVHLARADIARLGGWTTAGFEGAL